MKARYLLRQSPTVGDVPHLSPSAAPPLGQNTETNVSLATHATSQSLCDGHTLEVPASPLSPLSPFSPGAARPCGIARPLALGHPRHLGCLALPGVLRDLARRGHPWAGRPPHAARDKERPRIRMGENRIDSPFAPSLETTKKRQHRAESSSLSKRGARSRFVAPSFIFTKVGTPSPRADPHAFR